MRTLILEQKVLYLYILVIWYLPYLIILRLFLVRPVMDLPEPFEAYPGILGSLRETYELLYRGIELADYILDSHHHTEGHLSVDYRTGSQKRNKYVGGLCQKQ